MDERGNRLKRSRVQIVFETKQVMPFYQWGGQMWLNEKAII